MLSRRPLACEGGNPPGCLLGALGPEQCAGAAAAAGALVHLLFPGSLGLAHIVHGGVPVGLVGAGRGGGEAVSLLAPFWAGFGGCWRAGGAWPGFSGAPVES